MTQPDISELVAEAKRAINAILAKFETDSGEVVESLSIGAWDVTRFSDTSPRRIRSVEIEMFKRPNPNSKWEA